MKHIFVIDDEKNIRDIIKKFLEKEGFKVTLFDNGENVLTELKRLQPDLLIVDIMMPGIDGLELCRQIRKNNEIPIIFVSAKDEEFDRVLGLEIGGDDYLTKPFSLRELLARMKIIFKRIERAYGEDINFLIKNRDLTIYPNRRYVECKGMELELTTKEFELFNFLIINRNIPFTREKLVEKIWGYDYLGGERIIDDLVKRIRKKLNEIDSEVEIKTVWGFGYKIEDQT